MSYTLTGLRSHGMHRRPRSQRIVWPILPAALTAAAVAIPIGWAGPVSPPNAPRSCSHPSHVSGDAKRNPGGRQYVCTDGTWIPVTGYGYGLAAQITPAGEAKACAAVTAYRAHRSHRNAVVAISAARHADSELRSAITGYVRSGHGWSRVYGDCNPDA
jgi:hypothetical protein